MHFGFVNNMPKLLEFTVIPTFLHQINDFSENSEFIELGRLCFVHFKANIYTNSKNKSYYHSIKKIFRKSRNAEKYYSFTNLRSLVAFGDLFFSQFTIFLNQKWAIFLLQKHRRPTSCTNQRGGAVPEPVWVGSKWLLVFQRIPVTPGTPLEPFFAMLPPERPQKGSTQLF